MPSLKVLGRKLNPSSRVKVRLPTKNVDFRYNSSEWRALMDAIIRARGRICEDPDHDPSTRRAKACAYSAITFRNCVTVARCSMRATSCCVVARVTHARLQRSARNE